MTQTYWCNVYHDPDFPEFGTYIGNSEHYSVEEADGSSSTAAQAGIRTLYRIKVTLKDAK